MYIKWGGGGEGIDRYVVTLYICQVREDEMAELGTLLKNCFLPADGGVSNSHGKVNILLQAFISRDILDSFSLTSDLSYVAKVCVCVHCLLETCFIGLS